MRLSAQAHQGSFGRVTVRLPLIAVLADTRIVAEHPSLDEPGRDRVVGQLDFGPVDAELAFGLVADAFDFDIVLGSANGLDRHLVPGQRSSFVGANNRHGAQGLDRGKAPDDGTTGGHTLHTKRKGDCHDRWQPFRDGCNSNGHGGEEHFVPVPAP